MDVFIAASDVIAGMLLQDGVTQDRIVTVHDGVNVSYIDKQPMVDAHATFWLPHGCAVVGNVAALVPHKGQRHFVAAARKVIRELPDTRFVIVGEGELREALEKQVKDLALERHVFLAGFRPDALGLMKSFDVFAMSSVTEGLGSAILEAMTSRRPVVATRAGGIPEVIVDGESGLLVPPHDDDALAAAILRVLRDRELAARLADGGRRRVEAEFSVERLVAGTLAVYEQFGQKPSP